MENPLKLSLQNQNHFNQTAFDSIVRDSKRYAEGENIAEYFLRDFDANPDGWDNMFEFTYNEVSAKAKEERRNIIERLLAFAGYVA